MYTYIYIYIYIYILYIYIHIHIRIMYIHRPPRRPKAPALFSLSLSASLLSSLSRLNSNDIISNNGKLTIIEAM